MTKIQESPELCPVHRAYRAIRRSNLLRVAMAANIAALKLARDIVDRRLVRLEKQIRRGETAHVTVSQESS